MESFASKFSLGRGGLLPQEEMLEINNKKQQLRIGVLKESDTNEHRIALTPQAVELLHANGYSVFFERGAGLGALFSDQEYSEAGAEIKDTKEEVYEADVLLKVAPFSQKDIQLLKEHQIVLSSFLINDKAKQNVQDLLSKKVTAIGFEYIRDFEGNYPVVASMQEIAGSMSILIAAQCLSDSKYGKGALLGGITGVTPAEVVILGANTAGEFAARAAIGLGAHVKIFDACLQRLISIQNALGQRVYTSNFQAEVLKKAFRSAEVIIGSMQLVEDNTNFYVSEEMVKRMKKGSVIIDLSIDQGGCFETSKCTTHQNPFYTKHGVIHYCVPNIQSSAARTSSIALSNIVMPILLKMGEHEGISHFLKNDYTVRQGVYIYNGILTSSHISKHYDFPYKSIDLLMAAF
ncbi:MAG: alanine dehydrogenase [Bacteroidales bacterium]|jgi:alanine dehydrogenase|nr:alanine dehydrogenase [Bacteroidales bacterium]